jgi:FKBP-type peptidyl-prolyl cis-trans isomerase 2
MRIASYSALVAVTVCCLLQGTVSIGAPADQQIADGSKVTLEYTLTLPDKSVADSNVGQEPFSYVQGQHQIVPGLEKALLGMKAGQKKHVTVPPDQAYGPYDDKARVTVEKSKVPPNVKVGTMLRASNGQTVTVLEVSDQNVVLDLNHPLAGKDLTFDVTVLKVEKAPAEKSSTGKATTETSSADTPPAEKPSAEKSSKPGKP